MEYQKVSCAPFSKKLANSHSFSGTSIYDGVFRSPMKVASYVQEDYGEIFGGSSSSSIPVLDVPELNEKKATVDVKRSQLDYSKIFGCFGEFDSAVSHEELSAKSSKRDSFFKEARTETESHFSSVSVENQVLPRQTSYQPIDGVKEFKMSYNKTNQERRNGTTRVTQLHAVPGYTCLIDEFSPSQVTEGDRPLSSALNGTHPDGNFSGGEGEHSLKASSFLSPSGASKQGSGDGVEFQNGFNHSSFSSSDMLFDAYETGPSTHPPKVPLPSSQSDSLLNNSGDCKTSKDSNIGISKNSSSEDATGFCSPPYFEEEVDTNSVASVSAAAVKKAIEEAQARIKIAKQIMERKKDGLQNHVKLRFNNGPSMEERREGKNTYRTNKFTEEVQQKCAQADAQLPAFAGIGTQNAIKAGHMAPDFRGKEAVLFAKEAPVGTQRDKYNSTLMDQRGEERKDLKIEEGEGIGTMSAQLVNDFELKERIFSVKIFEHLDENGKKLKAIEEPHKQEDEVERMLKVEQGACELKESAFEQKSGQGVQDQEECGEKSKVDGLQEEKEVIFKASHEVEAREKKPRRQWERNANEKLKMQMEKLEECGKKPGDQEECGMKSMVPMLQEVKEVTYKECLGIENRGKKQRRLWEPNANESKLVMLELKDNECLKMRLLKDEQVGLENEKEQKDILEQKETDTRYEDVPEKEEKETALTETFDHEENGKRIGATCDRVEFEKHHTEAEACRLEVYEDEQEDVNGREDSEKTSDEALEHEIEVQINEFHDVVRNGKKLEEDVGLGAVEKLIVAEKISGEALEQEIEVRINEFHDMKQSEKKVEEDVGLGAKERLMVAEETEHILKRHYRLEEIEKRIEESCEWEEDTENFQTEIDQRGDDVNMELIQKACEHFRNNLYAADSMHQQDKIEIPCQTLEASLHYADDEFLEIPSYEGNGGVMDATQTSSECKEMETEANVVDLANGQKEEGVFENETADFAQAVLERDQIEKQVKDTSEAQIFLHNGLNIGVPDNDVWQKPSNQHEREFDAICKDGNGGEEMASELEEKIEDAEEVEGAMNLEEDGGNSESSNGERWVDSGDKMEASQLHSMIQGKGLSIEITHRIISSHNEEMYNDDHSESLKTEGMEAEGTMQKEMELQKEQVEKIDLAKEKERERERENERLAVERAIREARERAFIEAREKAERASVEKPNVEARRSAMAEARERSVKAPGEVNHKSLADKTAEEARLKAERAAVERATAEARTRALEKAMSKKAASKARSQAVKSSGPFRENGMKHSSASNDSPSKGSGANKSSGSSNSSSHDVPHSTDKLGVHCEPVQRHKARLESHQRMADRVAKALAEKNMRDLRAQKEQAERNRLAEALDADVKRWSHGKAGNLRALLSTLQYILGPDSGWQPIPLTDLIATAAVKKAYRKANLFVHPDKLQQRGASIQQKYTCEKVFDLLQEAWNRFNASEER